MSMQGKKVKFKKVWCEQLIEHMAAGYGYYAFAGKLRLHPSTIANFEKLYPEWLYAKEIAFLANEYYWDTLAVDSAKPGLVKYNMTSIIFNLKNRFPKRWKDVHETHDSKTVEYVIRHQKVTAPPAPKKEDKPKDK